MSTTAAIRPAGLKGESARETPTRLGADSAGLRMTPAEFDAIGDYDESLRYELVQGVLTVTPIPSEQEAEPNDVLGHFLRAYQLNHEQGSRIDSTMPERYIHTKGSRRRADRVVWVGLGRRPDPVKDVPAIAIEFVSKGRQNWRRDYLEKREEYLAAGVTEYWLFDRFSRTMTIYRKAGAGSNEQVLSESEMFTTPLLPGFELPVSKIFKYADIWG